MIRSDAIRSETCYNCGAPLAGGFCGRCGQKAQPLDPSLTDFLHELAHELFHLDGKILRSVVALLLQPGLLTRDYFEGKKARWVPPIRLYLVFSVIFFTVVSVADVAGEEFAHTTSRLMVVLLPAFALLVMPAAREHRNLPQHLYFALHVHGAWYAAWTIREGAALLSPRFVSSTRPLGHIMLAYMIAYAIQAFRIAYRERLWISVVKMVLVLGLYLAAIVLAGMLVTYLRQA